MALVLHTPAGALRMRCVVPGGSPYAVLDVALPEGARLDLIEEASAETGRGPQDVRAASPRPWGKTRASQ
jgi:hypothetical protein